MAIEQTKKKNVPFHSELIQEILLRLPLKSLVRFRSLSKQCLSTLSDPQFTKSRSDLVGAAPTNGLLYISHHDSEARWLDVDASSSLSHYHAVRLPVPYHGELAIIDSCGGFVLLEHYRRYQWDRPCFIMWNPLTGVHKKLSHQYSRTLWYRLFPYGQVLPYFRGFGYDESTDDYLVVTGWVESRNINESVIRLEYLSVRTDSWTETTITYPPHLVWIECDSGVFFNGAIHWLADTEHSHDVHSTVIVAFDLAGKSISEIQPPDSPGNCFRFGRLKVLGGCLSVVCRYEFWVMKEYKVHSSWTERSAPRIRDIIPMCFTKGGELIAVEDLSGLVKFNDKGMLVERRSEFFNEDSYAGAKRPPREVMFTATLLSIPGDFGSTRKDDH